MLSSNNESQGQQGILGCLCQTIQQYLQGCQVFRPGKYFGAFWSEKAYHGPLLDYHAGGAHHYRGAGSAAAGLYMIGKKTNNTQLCYNAEHAFDWLITRQHSRGGWQEVQNNDVPSDWERTGLDELSTISTAFVVHGLAFALRNGLAPKASYEVALQKAAMWQLSIERPADSGVFPHHERSPYDCLNANLHAAETLAAGYCVLRDVYGRPVNIFLQGAVRAIRHTITQQWPNGCFPYRANCGSTINYTSLVLWCMLNISDMLGDTTPIEGGVIGVTEREAMNKAAAFLRVCVDEEGRLLWEDNETSSAKNNAWTYAITYNVLRRIGGSENEECAEKILSCLWSSVSDSGLLPMRDCGEVITECAFMQADMLLFFLPFLYEEESRAGDE